MKIKFLTELFSFVKKCKLWLRSKGAGFTMEYDSQKLIDDLNAKWQMKICPLCGKQDWAVAGTVFELREFHGADNFIIGSGPIQPVVPITCMNCGNTILINPMISRSIENRTDEDKNG